MSEHALRHQLWLNHGHRTPAALYGDDGEMQCHACHRDGHPWDYKRAPLVELVPAALREIDTLRAQLAECYRLTDRRRRGLPVEGQP